ncbi:hypothetical protein CGT99_06905 [Vibrio metoecus]|nr:hypothetical protein CGT99_06905 [Vibrio metoecus]
MHSNLITMALLGLSFSVEASYLDITHFGAIPNDDIDDSQPFQLALNSLTHGDVLVIPSGTYQICNSLYLKNKNNIEIIGLGESKLKKCRNFQGEYLLSITYTENLKLQDLSFEGIHNGNQQPVWGEQGVYLGSTKNTLVTQNHFKTFGDAALRVTTSSLDQSATPGSQSVTVSDNDFEDCTQVTTTQATQGTEMAGTQNIMIDNNRFIGCKLKLSARADTRGAKVINNLFSNINGTSNEISYYSDVTYENNRFENISGFAINIYPNARTSKPVQWGSIHIANNNLENIQQGIRLQSFSDHDDNHQAIENIEIIKNTFKGIYFGNGIENKYKAIIRTVSNDKNVSFNNVKIIENHYNLTPYSSFFSIDNKSTSLYINNNIQTAVTNDTEKQ